MPRKPKAWSSKELQKAAKEQERIFITAWVNFFNQDPVEYFRNAQGFQHEFAKIARDPEKQETLRQSFKQVADAVKAVIIAYEDLWQGRARDNGIKDLQKAAKALDELIEIKTTYKLGVSNAGNVSDAPVIFEATSKLDFISSIFLNRVAHAVANFKDWLDHYKERLPIGVCRYEKCQQFFVKERRDERYCSPRHANTAAVRKKRERERSKRGKSSR
ncbi:MAG: hypothetical protein QXD59_06195 [Candidatus Caldarchaeum sp.]